MVSGLVEIASVGQTSTHNAQPSGQRVTSIFSLPRNRAGVEAAITSGITGWPSATRTASALGNGKFISNLGLWRLDPFQARHFRGTTGEARCKRLRSCTHLVLLSTNCDIILLPCP